ncbi:MAG: hypothetical protein ACHQ50_05620, partial [Fimbriimonadales bacterium]
MNPIAKAGYVIVSFLMSLILWLYVQEQVSPTKPPPSSYRVPITLRNLPAEYVPPQQPDDIEVFPQGSIEERSRISKTDLSAFVDLSHPVKGPHIYPVHLDVKGDPKVRWEPQPLQTQINVQPRASKRIPVHVQTYGSLTDSGFLYVPRLTVTDPPMVTVIGPESD